jgi:PAS domain S-box-containing protein
MKTRITPRNHEIVMQDGEFIVSKTDPSGRITYCNRTFMKVSGFSERELLNVQHNIIRHPDMPRGVFRFLWQTLEQGQEFFGFVKNMTADGSFYWVFANVTPDYDRNGRLTGYFSVRRKPLPSAIATLEPIYREMLAVEQRAGPKEAPDASIAYLQQTLKSLGTPYEGLVLSLQPSH